VVIIAVMLALAVILTDPQLMLVLLFSAYATSGPLLTLWLLRQKKSRRKIMR
jgi:CDP-diacylglycerol--serine O-phosphatidyltransferase